MISTRILVPKRNIVKIVSDLNFNRIFGAIRVDPLGLYITSCTHQATRCQVTNLFFKNTNAFSTFDYRNFEFEIFKSNYENGFENSSFTCVCQMKSDSYAQIEPRKGLDVATSKNAQYCWRHHATYCLWYHESYENFATRCRFCITGLFFFWTFI